MPSPVHPRGHPTSADTHIQKRQANSQRGRQPLPNQILSAESKVVDKRLPWVADCLVVMGKAEPYQNRIELLQGTLDMLILRTLQWGAQHGHGIGMAIRASSQDVLHVEH